MENVESLPEGQRDAASEDGPSVETPEVDWQDRYIRLAADFDNFRKRVRSEQEEARRREVERVNAHWLEVLDATERALATGGEGPWFEGLEAIHHQMEQVLSKQKLTRIATDIAFDPHLHEALSVMPGGGQPDGTILHTERAGFLFEDGVVLRPARVVVARG